MTHEVVGEGMDEVDLVVGKHLIDGVPLLHDELVRDVHLREYHVEHLDIIA